MKLHNEAYWNAMSVIYPVEKSHTLGFYMNINRVQVPWIFALVISRRKTFEPPLPLSKQTVSLNSLELQWSSLFWNITFPLFLRVPYRQCNMCTRALIRIVRHNIWTKVVFFHLLSCYEKCMLGNWNGSCTAWISLTKDVSKCVTCQRRILTRWNINFMSYVKNNSKQIRIAIAKHISTKWNWWDRNMTVQMMFQQFCTEKTILKM